MGTTPVEKVYVVLEGEVTVITESGTATLGRLDSCRLAPNEARAIENRGNLPASMLVVMPYPQPQP
jgi:mannose-6-phosphate isomerase-like protein (cupin superfamily)